MSDKRLTANYLYLANKKTYLLGVRKNNLKKAIILIILIGSLSIYLSAMIAVVFLIVGKIIDKKQSKEERDLKEAFWAWQKIKGLHIRDKNGDLLKSIKS